MGYIQRSAAVLRHRTDENRCTSRCLLGILEHMLVSRTIGSTIFVWDDTHAKLRPDIEAFFVEHSQYLATKVGEAIVVLGGDGTFLSARQQLGQSQEEENTPFLGINFGTKGFLLQQAQDVLLAERLETVSLQQIRATLEVDGKIYEADALNEVYCKTAGGNVLDLTVTAEGIGTLNIQGDGILVATPTGSTAYATSAGGPILPHGVEALVCAPLLPFLPRGLRPFVVPQNIRLSIHAHLRHNHSVSVYADNRALLEDGKQDFTLHVELSRRCCPMLVPAQAMSSYTRRAWREIGFVSE